MFACFSTILEPWPSDHVRVCATAIVPVGGAGKGNGLLRVKWQVWAWELCLAVSGPGDRKCRFSATCVSDLLLLADVITMAQSQALILRDCYLVTVQCFWLWPSSPYCDSGWWLWPLWLYSPCLWLPMFAMFASPPPALNVENVARVAATRGARSHGTSQPQPAVLIWSLGMSLYLDLRYL